MTKMTTAEFRGYQQICGRDGAMMVIAADQRGGMRKIMAASPADQESKPSPKRCSARPRPTSRNTSQARLRASCSTLICAVPNVVDDGVLARDTALPDRP